MATVCNPQGTVDDQFHRLANASVGKLDRFGRYNGFFKDTVEQTE